MPLFDFLNIFKRPEDLMRTPGFNPGAENIIRPPVTPKPSPAVPLNLPELPKPKPKPSLVVPLNLPELPKPNVSLVPPPAPGVRPAPLQMADTDQLRGANLTPPQLAENPHPRAPYDIMRRTMMSGEVPLDRTGMNVAREQYVSERGGKHTFGGILGNAALGFLQSAAQNPDNPLAAGLGGAAVGGIGSAISPRMGAEYRFGALEAPRLEQAYGEQQQEQQHRLRQALDMARIGQEQAQRQKYEAEAERAGRPVLHNAAMDQDVFGTDNAGRTRLIRPGRAKPAAPPRPIFRMSVDAQGKPVWTDVSQQPNAPAYVRPQAERGEGVTPYQREQLNRQSEKDSQARLRDARKAAAEFEKAKQAALDPGELSSQIESLREEFGDLLEIGVGVGGWPYAKLKPGAGKKRDVGNTSPGGARSLSDLVNKYF